MRPRVVVHNSVSIDGSVLGFPVDMASHYGLVPQWNAEVHLVGSITFRSGIELFGGVEEGEEHLRPGLDDTKPWWVLPDSTGRLHGMLHNARDFGACRDPVILVTEQTPESYLAYLRDREYRFHVVGAERVDLHAALELCATEYGAATVLTDTGPRLVGALLDRDLVDLFSLLVAPHVVGRGDDHANLFARCGSRELRLIKHDNAGVGLHAIWEVVR